MKIQMIALVAPALLLAAPQGFAQTPVAPAAAVAPTTGPLIPGMCVFSQSAALGQSVVGKYVGQRLEQINAQSNAELNGQRSALETEAKTLDGQRASMTQEAFAAQATAIQQKANQFQNLVNQRVRESELTEAKALERIGQDLTPLMIEVFKARNCSILLDRQAAYMTSQAMDVTNDVVVKLDAKLTTFPFERERMENQPPAAAAGAPPAAGPARAGTTPPAGGRAGPATPAAGRAGPPAPGRAGR